MPPDDGSERETLIIFVALAGYQLENLPNISVQ